MAFLLAGACSRSNADEAVPSKAALLTAIPANSVATTTSSAAEAMATSAAAATPAPAASRSAAPASPPPGIRATCEELCAHARQLKCGGEQPCVEGCMEMASLKPCTAAFRELYACLLRQPLTHWECGDDRMGAIRDGYCEKEQEAAARCVGALTKQ